MKINTGVYMSGTQQNKLSLYQKLVEVRKNALYISKADEGFKFKYANGADILAAVRPAMDEHGVLLLTNMEHFELIQPKGMLVTMSYTWVNADNPAEQLRTNLTFYEDKMTGCQGVGSILTYGERYFMYKFFNVATDSDSPEKFYAKQGWSCIDEDEPEEEKKKAEKKKDSRITNAIVTLKTFEFYQRAAAKLWDLMKSHDESMKNWQMRQELPFYMYFTQKRMQDRDVLNDFKEQAKNPKLLIAAMETWLKNGGDREVESHQWSMSLDNAAVNEAEKSG